MLLTEGRAGDQKAIVRVSHVQEEAGRLGTSGQVASLTRWRRGHHESRESQGYTELGIED